MSEQERNTKYAIAAVAALIAGYALYKLTSKSDKTVSDKRKIKMGKKNEAIDKYYGGDEEFRWFELINQS